MDWIASLVAAVIGFLGLSGWRLRMSGRLRTNVAAELDILAKMPPGEARDALRDHIDAQVRLLIAEEEGLRSDERQDRRWALAFAASGILLPLVVSPLVAPGGPPWLLPVVLLLGIGMVAYGTDLWTRTSRQVAARRWVKRAEAEGDPVDQAT